MLNDFLLFKLDELEDLGIDALKKEESREALYITRCKGDPHIYGDMQYRKEYLEAIRERIKKLEGSD